MPYPSREGKCFQAQFRSTPPLAQFQKILVIPAWSLVRQRTDYGPALPPSPAAAGAEFCSDHGRTQAGGDAGRGLAQTPVLRAASAVRAGLEAAQGLASGVWKTSRDGACTPSPCSQPCCLCVLPGKKFCACCPCPRQRKRPLSRRALGAAVRKRSLRRGERTPSKRHPSRGERPGQSGVGPPRRQA